jgi:hypothetical protein
MENIEELIDLRERGAEKDGERQEMDRRLFMQLLVFRVPLSQQPTEAVSRLGETCQKTNLSAVIYEDVNDPRGIAILTWSEDPSHFVTTVRPVLQLAGNRELELRPEYTMLGRTYSSGHEPDLPFWLLERPIETALNEAWPWAIWYPLRRSGSFAQLTPREQGSILREHGVIGRAYGAKDHAHDIRLACHGIDAHDNEFVIGLIGKGLHPLSHVIQTMRKTKQTSEYITKMGPFFVGRVAFRVGEGDGG